MSKLMAQQKCDICGRTPNTIYDAPTRSGRWAWMCGGCWIIHRRSPRLGTGMGQRWVNEAGGAKLAG